VTRTCEATGFGIFAHEPTCRRGRPGGKAAHGHRTSPHAIHHKRSCRARAQCAGPGSNWRGLRPTAHRAVGARGGPTPAAGAPMAARAPADIELDRNRGHVPGRAAHTRAEAPTGAASCGRGRDRDPGRGRDGDRGRGRARGQVSVRGRSSGCDRSRLRDRDQRRVRDRAGGAHHRGRRPGPGRCGQPGRTHREVRDSASQ
jgi:hypothetical protein